MEEIIKVENLKVDFEGKRVLNGVSIGINEGESIVIVGSSGCGKTVLLKTILGLIQPVEGEIYIFGKNI
ncbi:MAG TPA: ATP-binding cassette domain-containing protein, partial [Firmicutes bacterium]|nr:ATP-binding cassette domain-containing protein [Bacillota bacterium]